MLELVVLNEPDSARRSCYDCGHLKAAVSWWCTNKKCIEWRGTSIPGVHNCPFWKPARMKSELTKKEKRSGNYIVCE